MKITLVILILNSFILVKASDNHQQHSTNEQSNATSPKIKLSKDQLKELQITFQNYEKLHSSFLNYDPKKVQLNAKNLASSIDKISNPDILKNLDYSKKRLVEITSKNKRTLNNQNFYLVSMAFIHLMNTYELQKDYSVYYCPMAKKKWIQNAQKTQETQNPYAANMSSCGEKQ